MTVIYLALVLLAVAVGFVSEARQLETTLRRHTTRTDERTHP